MKRDSSADPQELVQYAPSFDKASAKTVRPVSPSSSVILLCFAKFSYEIRVLREVATALRSVPERTSCIFMARHCYCKKKIILKCGVIQQ